MVAIGKKENEVLEKNELVEKKVLEEPELWVRIKRGDVTVEEKDASQKEQFQKEERPKEDHQEEGKTGKKIKELYRNI